MNDQKKVYRCTKAIDSGTAVDFMRYQVTRKVFWLRDYIANEGRDGILFWQYSQELRSLWRLYRSAQWDERVRKTRGGSYDF